MFGRRHLMRTDVTLCVDLCSLAFQRHEDADMFMSLSDIIKEVFADPLGMSASAKTKSGLTLSTADCPSFGKCGHGPVGAHKVSSQGVSLSETGSILR